MAEKDGGCVCLELIATSGLSTFRATAIGLCLLFLFARLVTKELPCMHWRKKAQQSFMERKGAANQVFLLS